MAWPSWQHTTSHRNVFHRTQFALHRTTSHCIYSLCTHSSLLCTVQYGNTAHWIALHRVASYPPCMATQQIGSHRIASPHISHAAPCIIHTEHRLIITSYHIEPHHFASHRFALASLHIALHRIASCCTASHHIALHCIAHESHLTASHGIASPHFMSSSIIAMPQTRTKTLLYLCSGPELWRAACTSLLRGLGVSSLLDAR